jgi:hypothetical protein
MEFVQTVELLIAASLALFCFGVGVVVGFTIADLLD